MGRPLSYDKEKVEDYIRLHYKEQTKEEMALVLGLHVQIVGKLLLSMRLLALNRLVTASGRPVSINQQRIEEYIRINHYYETPQVMAAFLAIDIRYVYEMLKQLGLKPCKPVLDYVLENIDKRTIEAMAEYLGRTVDYLRALCNEHNLPYLSDGTGRGHNNGYYAKITDKNSIHYWPDFEEMDERWHDALLDIAAEVYGQEYNRRKARRQANCPKAEYDQTISSDVLREFLSDCGVNIKK